MRLKCPGCGKLLNIPDSAAGKVVKCPCGKQLRAPASKAAAPKAAAPKAAAAKPATPRSSRPSSARPAAPAATPKQTPLPAVGGIQDDFFNDLTESDLAPVKAVHQPGVRAAAPAAPAGHSAITADASGGHAVPRPMPMYFGAVYCVITAMIFSLILLSLLAAFGIVVFGGEADSSQKTRQVLGQIANIGAAAVVIVGLKVVLEFAAAASCFLRGKGAYSTVVFTFAYSAFSSLANLANAVYVGNIGQAAVAGFNLILTTAFLAYLFTLKPRSYFGKDVKLRHAVTHTVIGLVALIALVVAVAVVIQRRGPGSAPPQTLSRHAPKETQRQFDFVGAELTVLSVPS